nr:MAG TPA: hypothetical protein [Caudoviricetes sp.]DAL69238.1 MAG TPA: hypothetical protein [Caudoviricetes sp.]
MHEGNPLWSAFFIPFFQLCLNEVAPSVLLPLLRRK